MRLISEIFILKPCLQKLECWLMGKKKVFFVAVPNSTMVFSGGFFALDFFSWFNCFPDFLGICLLPRCNNLFHTVFIIYFHVLFILNCCEYPKQNKKNWNIKLIMVSNIKCCFLYLPPPHFQVLKNGLTNSVFTLYELSNGEDTEEEGAFSIIVICNSVERDINCLCFFCLVFNPENLSCCPHSSLAEFLKVDLSFL